MCANLPDITLSSEFRRYKLLFFLILIPDQADTHVALPRTWTKLCLRDDLCEPHGLRNGPIFALQAARMLLSLHIEDLHPLRWIYLLPAMVLG